MMKYNEVNKMSNAEHLIENAVCCLERGQSYEDFADAKYNREMAEACRIDLIQVWLMAVYVVYNLKPHWVSDTVDYFQRQDNVDDKMKAYIENYLW